MSMDLSSLNSINSLLGSTYGSTNTATQATPSSSFENYLMNALGGQTSSTNTSTSPLSDLLSGSSTTSLLNGLTSSSSSSDTVSQLIQSLQSSGSTDASVNNLYNSSATNAATDTFASSLSNSFQAQILNNMNAAKAKLQNSYTSYVERAGENPTVAAKLRMEQMQQNMQIVDNYIGSKSSDSSTNNQYDALLSQLSGSTGAASTSQSLLDQLDAKSSLSQYLLNL